MTARHFEASLSRGKAFLRALQESYFQKPRAVSTAEKLYASLIRDGESCS